MRRAGALLVGLALSGCKKKAPDGPELPPPPVGVESALQVVSVSPGLIGADRPASVTVVGAGFVQGAAVRVGQTPAAAVTFRNQNQLEAALPALPGGLYDVTVTLPDTSEATLRAGLVVRDGGVAGASATAACQSVVVWFDTDQSGLTAAARSTLDGLVGCWQSTGAALAVEGHADERGTTDYNLALGQRRALAVRSHLVAAGLEPMRLRVTSMGEERPADPGHGEAAWAKNRRVELTLQ